MDFKDKIQEIIKKISTDKDFKKKFDKTPVKAIEEVIGIDLPDEKLDAIITMVKAKGALESLTGKKSSSKKSNSKNDGTDLGDIIDTVKNFLN